MIANGMVLIVAMVLLFVKLPRRTAFKLLGYPLALDIFVTVVMSIVHWGTFSGLMAAAFAGLLCSVVSSGARWAFGYIDPKTRKFIPGRIALKDTK